MNTRSLTAKLVLFVLAVPAVGAAQGIVSWKDENGVTHFGDRVPPEYANKDREVLNERGIVVDRRQGVTDEQRAGVVEILNGTLADLHVLYTKTRNYHWNVVGEHFRDLHKLLEEQYEALAESIDEVAERTRMLGYDPFRYRLAALALSGLYAGVAGAAYALAFGYVGASFASVQCSGT